MTGATLWQRCKALAYDFLFAGLLLFAAMIHADRMGLVGGMVASWIIGWVVHLGYRVLGHARWGQTPGKSLAGIQVVRLDGGPLSWRQALLREVDTASVLWVTALVSSIWAALHIPDLAAYTAMDWSRRWQLRESLELIPMGLSLWVSAVSGVGELLVVTLTTRRRAVHDLLAGTRVIDVRPGTGAARPRALLLGNGLVVCGVVIGSAALGLVLTAHPRVAVTAPSAKAVEVQGLVTALMRDPFAVEPLEALRRALGSAERLRVVSQTLIKLTGRVANAFPLHVLAARINEAAANRPVMLQQLRLAAQRAPRQPRMLANLAAYSEAVGAHDVAAAAYEALAAAESRPAEASAAKAAKHLLDVNRALQLWQARLLAPPVTVLSDEGVIRKR